MARAKPPRSRCLLGWCALIGGAPSSSADRRSGAEGRRRLGYLPEAPYFYEHLNVRELLFYYGSLHGLPRREIRRRAETLIERVGLAHAADRPIRRFSKGMRQRAGLAQALINDPEVVILDEPQSGLDPVGRKDVRDLIFELKEQGKTVLFSSHILPDVEAVCDRVALLHLGTLREVGSLAELTSRSTDSVEVRAQGVRPEDLSGLDGLLRIEQRGAQWVLRVAEEAQLQAVIEAIYAAGGKIHAVVPHRHDLEDVFLRDTAAAAPPPGADAARGGE